jgi:hypothetical protein
MTLRRRIAWRGLKLAAGVLGLQLRAVVRASVVLKRWSDRLIDHDVPEVTVEEHVRVGGVLGLEAPVRVLETAPRRHLAALLGCPWCERDTIHLRSGDRMICIYANQHSTMFAYRALAAGLPDPELFPGCICVQNEVSVTGTPDPACCGLVHRP